MATPTEGHSLPAIPPRPAAALGLHNEQGRGPVGTRPSPAEVFKLSDPEAADKRILLLVYLHGFMGRDDSFKNFPLHLHRFLKGSLSDSHTITTKVYPRYKTYKAIEVARDNFSTWLREHESDKTDVILLGHSMGGLLSAEVVLMPDVIGNKFFQHRILGTVNLDAPLLGLHPGIIKSGIKSLFVKKPLPVPAPAGNVDETIPGPGRTEANSSGDSTADPSPEDVLKRLTIDPNFNPSFSNDVRMKDRSWWKNIVHFATKHNSEGLVDAATNHIASHMEFGSCLMDYEGMKLRYQTLRNLEDIDDYKYHNIPHAPQRVRFVQYYTVCYGYPETPKTPKTPQTSKSENPDVKGEAQDQVSPGSSRPSASSTPRPSLDGHSSTSPQGDDTESVPLSKQETLVEYQGVDGADELSLRSQETRTDNYFTPSSSRPSSSAGLDSMSDNNAMIPDPASPASPHREMDEGAGKASFNLPPPRDAPLIPTNSKPNLSHESSFGNLESKDEGKVNDRKKEKEKGKEKEAKTNEDGPDRHASTPKPEKPKKAEKPKKPPKKRKFCNVPSKVGGKRDSKWIEVFMKDVDEVAAHTGLFVPGPHYDKLIGDVGEMVVQWVHDDLTRSMVLALQESN